MGKKLSEKLQRELRDLRLLADDEIDLSDIPETTDWSTGLRGLWTNQAYETLNYDIRAVANEILTRAWKAGAKPTNMWLNKVAWFIYERMLAECGKLITQARAEAWDHGPVFREVYGPAKIYKDEPVAKLLEHFSMKSKRMETATVSVDAETSQAIDDAVARFKDKSASQLRNISHSEGSPWYRVWYSGQRTSAGMVISPNVILAAANARSKANE
ncbi:MAG TPA: type II toxin-antitoxin system antitoxin SocA domain-containing protein [Allosphingosinicella sp.]|jgi:uncharacterized phage-associated protein